MTLEKKLLGYDNDEPIYLSSPSWDCSWYVGFGYIGNSNYHSHLDLFLDEKEPNTNMFDQMQKVFGSTLCKELQNDSNLWRFCELFTSWATLKKTYELYNRGGSHYTHLEDIDLKSFYMATTSLKDLFKVVNGICELLDLNQIEYNDKIEKDVYNNMNPTTFTRRTPTTSNKKEWKLVYLNKYDNPENHKDKIIPSKVLKDWKKWQTDDTVMHQKFQSLVNTNSFKSQVLN